MTKSTLKKTQTGINNSDFDRKQITDNTQNQDKTNNNEYKTRIKRY